VATVYSNQLLEIDYSPIAALNRTHALAKVRGKGEAIKEAEKLNLKGNQFYYALLGELFLGIDDAKAALNFSLALSHAKTTADKKILQKKLSELRE
jgi:predicted RNA polymerase sigma factor